MVWEKSSCVEIFPLEGKESYLFGIILGVIDPHLLKDNIEAKRS